MDRRTDRRKHQQQQPQQHARARATSAAADARPPVAGQARPFEPLERRVLMSVTLQDGWTQVTPDAGVDSRKVYVSNSTGNDNNTGASGAPVATISKGRSLLRDGFADQLLLKRGDTWSEPLGKWTRSGLNSANPMLIGSYGNSADPRPKIATTGATDGFGISGDAVNHLAIIGIEFDAQGNTAADHPYGMRILGPANNLLVEDCLIRDYDYNVSIQSQDATYSGPISNVRFRRSVIAHAHSSDGKKAQGMYASGVQGLTLEENVFDHNGWSETVAGATALVLNHNAYIASETSGLVVRGNVFANASSHGLQARPGGIVEDNVFLNNPIGLSYGLVNGSSTKPGGVSGSVRGNVFLGSNDINGQPRAYAMEIGNTSRTAQTIVEGNVIAHRTPGTGDSPAIHLTYGEELTNPTDAVGLNNLTVRDNKVYGWSQGVYLKHGLVPGGTGRTAVNDLRFENNDVQRLAQRTAIDVGSSFDPAEQVFANNDYDTADSTDVANVSQAGTVKTWATWRSQEGTESGSQEREITYPDAGRTANSYGATLGDQTGDGAANERDYLALARKQSRTTWRADATADALGDYIRAGFGIGGQQPPPPTDGNAIAANFAGGVGNTGADQYHGTAGDGWTQGWGLAGYRAVFQGDTVKNVDPLRAGGNYLAARLVANDPAGGGQAGVGRGYATNAARGVDTGAAHTIQFDYRFDGSLANFTGFDDRAVIFGDGKESHGTQAGNTWVAAAYGAANGTLAAKRWGFQNGDQAGGAGTFVDTGVPLATGTVYHFTINVDPASRTYTASINDGGTGAGHSFTSGTLKWRTPDAFTSATPTFVNFTGKTDTSGETVEYSVDSVRVAGAATGSGAAPAAPTNFSATKQSSSLIRLVWADVAGETGYRVERKLGSGQWTQIATPAAGATAYDDTNLPPNTAFVYRIRAVNGSVNGAYSAEDGSTTNAPSSTTLLAAPGASYATASGPSTIGLEWNDVAGESGYLIERKLGDTGTWSSLAIVNAGSTSYTDGGLQSGTRYVYRVKAYSTTNDGAWSLEDGSTTHTA